MNTFELVDLLDSWTPHFVSSPVPSPAPWTRSEESQPHGPKQMDPYLAMASVWHCGAWWAWGVSVWKKKYGCRYTPNSTWWSPPSNGHFADFFSGRPVYPNFRETHLWKNPLYMFSMMLHPKFWYHNHNQKHDRSVVHGNGEYQSTQKVDFNIFQPTSINLKARNEL